MPGQIDCYRCGTTILADRFDLEGWVVLHAWDDGHALFVCAACQTPVERDQARLSRPSD